MGQNDQVEDDPDPATPDRGTVDRQRRRYGPTLVLGLLGSIGVVVGASRSWASASATVPGLPTMHATVSGTDLAPVVGAFGVAMLAAFGAVIATRGWVRRGLGIAVFVASLVIVVEALHPGGSTQALRDGLSAKGWTGGPFATSTSSWRWLVLVAAIVTAAAGLATARFGAQWAVMGARYDAPTGSTAPARRAPRSASGAEPDETEVWHAIDRGDDPTSEG